MESTTLYSIENLLKDGEKIYGRNSKQSGLGTKKVLSSIIKQDTPLYSAIDTMVWGRKTTSHLFGPVVSF